MKTLIEYLLTNTMERREGDAHGVEGEEEEKGEGGNGEIMKLLPL